VYDIVLAVLIMLFVLFALMSPTLGNSHFYSRYMSNSSITSYLQDSLKEKTATIADKTGIEKEAFDFAVGQKKISSTQKEMINSVFAGNNYDYTDSASIESCYRDGITEYYRYNGLDLDADALDKAVPLACSAFNETLSIGNNNEMNSLITFLSKYSIVLAVVMLVIAIILGLKIFSLHGGRTKVLSHYGCSLACAGDAMIAVFICNIIVHFANRLYLTNNEGLNVAINSASNTFMLIYALFGLAFVIAGISLNTYVGKYYRRKAQKQKQESEINRTLYVKREDGEDKTVEQIYEDRRKELENNETV
jgi:hypothetical protein